MTLNEQVNKRIEYTQEYIERMANALELAPVPERPMSKRDALVKLAPALKAAQAKGHALQGIVDMLAQQGLQTHVRAVSAAIARAGASQPARAKRAKSAPVSTSGEQT